MVLLKEAGAALLAVSAMTFAAAPALALTVANQSDKAQEITVDRGADEPRTKIDAGKSANLECPGGCEVRVVGMGYGLPARDGDKIVVGKDLLLSYADQEQASSDEAAASGAKKMAE